MKPQSFKSIFNSLSPELKDQTGWQKRFDAPAATKFKSISGTFADVVDTFGDIALDRLSTSNLQWAAEVIRTDRTTPAPVLEAFAAPVLSALSKRG